MEEFQKQETIENIKERVETLKKNAKPPTYVPGNQEVGSTVKIGETLYRVVNFQGTLRRIDVKEPSKIRKQRDVIAHLLSLQNPNLKHRLEREERMNKIKMFNKVQKDLESNMNIVESLHPKSFTPSTEKKMVEIPEVEPVMSVEGSEDQKNLETLPPKATFDYNDPAYIEMMRINNKTRILKQKRRAANKLASQKRKHNVKFNNN